MLVLIFIFLVVLLIQFLLAIYALIVRLGIEKRYNHPLSEQVEAASALELYSRIYRKVNLGVNTDIKLPAYAFEEYVMINKDKMYFFDLYTNFFTIYQLELSKKEYNFARNLFKFQNFLFFLQLFLFITGLVIQFEWKDIVILFAVVIQIFNIFIGFAGFTIFDGLLKDVFDISADILNLDEVERFRADALRKDLKFHVFEYPFDFFLRIFKFFLP